MASKRAVLTQLWNDGVPADEIALRAGYSDRKTVVDTARKMRLPSRRKSRPWLDTEVATLRLMAAEGAKITVIARVLERPHMAVQDKIYRLRVEDGELKNYPDRDADRKAAMIGMTRRCQCGCGQKFTIVYAAESDDLLSPMCRARGRKASAPDRSLTGSTAAMCAA